MNLSQSILLQASVAIATIVGSNYTSAPSITDKKVDYNEFKKEVSTNKRLLINHPAKDLRSYLFKLVDKDIYDYWAGTRWSFYGKTQQPKTGSIACGYFVTTTLTDLGFKIDRVGLAECRSGDMIKKLCTGIRSFNRFSKLDGYLAMQPVNSVFIIGLDFHTGYVVKNAAGCYFFHSCYINNEGVVKEKIDESPVLKTNKFFMIGSLTANEDLLRKWVANKP